MIAVVPSRLHNWAIGVAESDFREITLGGSRLIICLFGGVGEAHQEEGCSIKYRRASGLHSACICKREARLAGNHRARVSCGGVAVRTVLHEGGRLISYCKRLDAM